MTLEVLLTKETQTVSSLSRAFLSQTGKSLTKACGQRPLDFLARYPKRFQVHDDGITVSALLRERTEMSNSEWLATAAVVQGTNDQDAIPNAFMQSIKDNLCIECDVEFAGSVGRNTATRNCRDVDIVLVLQTPASEFDRMSTPMLNMLPALMNNISVVCNSRKINVTIGQPDIEKKFVPCIVDGETIRVFVAPKEIEASPERQLTAWVASQSATVLHAIRIVKEWSFAQKWSSEYLKPSDLFLELMVIHAAKDIGSVGAAVTAAHELLRNAEFVRATFGKNVSQTMMPMVVDPFDATRNYADPMTFDASELSQFADASKNLAAPRSRCIDSDSTASFISATSSGPSSNPSTDLE